MKIKVDVSRLPEPRKYAELDSGRMPSLHADRKRSKKTKDSDEEYNSTAAGPSDVSGTSGPDEMPLSADVDGIDPMEEDESGEEQDMDGYSITDDDSDMDSC